MKIWRKRITELINNKGVCRTAPAIQGLLNMVGEKSGNATKQETIKDELEMQKEKGYLKETEIQVKEEEHEIEPKEEEQKRNQKMEIKII